MSESTEVTHFKGGPCAWTPQTEKPEEVTCFVCRLSMSEAVKAKLKEIRK